MRPESVIFKDGVVGDIDALSAAKQATVAASQARDKGLGCAFAVAQVFEAADAE
jgi:hypothetical protein